ncbi:MAG: hypothetical protein ACREHG_10095 [Candidatus Saccharimonadales bacterium]
MPSEYYQTNLDRGAYLPPSVANAMTEHLQMSVSPNLKKYIGPNRQGYVPKSAERAIAAAMDKSMPAQFKRYSGAYLQQHVVNSGASTALPQARVAAPHAPVPNVLRRDHNIPYGQQFTADTNMLPRAEQQMFETPSGQPGVPVQPTAEGMNYTAPPTPDYSFITNPVKPAPSGGFSIPGASPAVGRVIVVLLGLILLLVIYAIIKSALSGPSPVPAFTAVVQDQQEILHLSSNAANQQGLSTNNQLFTATASLSVQSAQIQLLNFMSSAGHKVSSKQLAQKLSPAIDNTLTSAQTAGTYDQAFTSTMQAQLNTYKSDISHAYALTSPYGKTLLNSDYKQADLLLTQLSSS